VPLHVIFGQPQNNYSCESDAHIYIYVRGCTLTKTRIKVERRSSFLTADSAEIFTGVVWILDRARAATFVSALYVFTARSLPGAGNYVDPTPCLCSDLLLAIQPPVLRR
jgi:hypothetical protein